MFLPNDETYISRNVNFSETLNILYLAELTTHLSFILDHLLTKLKLGKKCDFWPFALQKPNKADSGDYKCSVKNKWGNDHTTFNLGWKINTFLNFSCAIIAVYKTNIIILFSCLL